MNEAKHFISGRPIEDFLMTCVVNDKTKVSEHKRQKSSIAKFRPRIMKPGYQEESADEHGRIQKHLPAVIRRLLRQ